MRDPLPLSVRDARRAAQPLRTELAAHPAPPRATPRCRDRIAPGADDATHSRDLSEGQKPALVLDLQLNPPAAWTTGPRKS